jgi:hypothetical protein
VDYNIFEDNKLRGYSEADKKNIITILEEEVLTVRPMSRYYENLDIAIRIFRERR